MFQAYISVNWTPSPRIVTVAAPEVAVTIQDLYDSGTACHEAHGQKNVEPESLASPMIPNETRGYWHQEG